jgi:Bacteriophage clamp loader A subunit
MSPFDFVKSITETKEDIFEGNEKDYNPFVINKALSFNADCLYIVHELSKYPEMPKRAQYLFLLNSIEKKKRWGKWVKKDSLPEDIEIIKECFGYSDQKALSVLPLLNDKQLLELRKITCKGGRT